MKGRPETLVLLLGALLVSGATLWWSLRRSRTDLEIDQPTIVSGDSRTSAAKSLEAFMKEVELFKGDVTGWQSRLASAGEEVGPDEREVCRALSLRLTGEVERLVGDRSEIVTRFATMDSAHPTPDEWNRLASELVARSRIVSQSRAMWEAIVYVSLRKRQPNQALQTTPMTLRLREKVFVFGRHRRGV